MTVFLLLCAISGAPWMFVIFWFVGGALVCLDE